MHFFLKIIILITIILNLIVLSLFVDINISIYLCHTIIIINIYIIIHILCSIVDHSLYQGSFLILKILLCLISSVQLFYINHSYLGLSSSKSPLESRIISIFFSFFIELKASANVENVLCFINECLY